MLIKRFHISIFQSLCLFMIALICMQASSLEVSGSPGINRMKRLEMLSEKSGLEKRTDTWEIIRPTITKKVLPKIDMSVLYNKINFSDFESSISTTGFNVSDTSDKLDGELSILKADKIHPSPSMLRSTKIHSSDTKNFISGPIESSTDTVSPSKIEFYLTGSNRSQETFLPMSTKATQELISSEVHGISLLNLTKTPTITLQHSFIHSQNLNGTGSGKLIDNVARGINDSVEESQFVKTSSASIKIYTMSFNASNVLNSRVTSLESSLKDPLLSKTRPTPTLLRLSVSKAHPQINIPLQMSMSSSKSTIMRWTPSMENSLLDSKTQKVKWDQNPLLFQSNVLAISSSLSIELSLRALKSPSMILSSKFKPYSHLLFSVVNDFTPPNRNKTGSFPSTSSKSTSLHQNKLTLSYLAKSFATKSITSFTQSPVTPKSPILISKSMQKYENEASSAFMINTTKLTTNTSEDDDRDGITLRNETILKKYSITYNSPTTPRTTIIESTLNTSLKNSTVLKVRYCSKTIFETKHKGDYHLGKGFIKERIQAPCVYGGVLPNANATFICSLNDQWQSDVTFCFTTNKANEIIYEIANMNVDKSNVETFARYITTCLENYFDTILVVPRDVDILIDALQKIIKYGKSNDKVIMKALDIVNHLVKVKSNLMKNKKHLHKALDDITKAVDVTNNKFQFISQFIDLVVLKIEYGIQTEYTSKDLFGNETDAIYIPPSSITGNSRVFVYILRNRTILNQPKETTKHIISNAIAITIMDDKKYENLTEPFTIRFHVPDLAKYKPICSFWSETEDDWSSSGCQYDQNSDDKAKHIVICKCNHLTTFAVLGEILENGKESKKHALEKIFNLTIFTSFFVLLTLLGFTTITYVTFKKLRESTYSKIIIWLGLSLIFTTLSFVGSLTFVKESMPCFIASRFLHYFILTSFSWMLVQAVNLYRAIVVISVRRTEGRYFIWMSIAAIFVPLLISIIIGYFEYQRKHSYSICFVTGNLFYLGVIAPSSTILLLTLLLYVPIFKSIIVFEQMIKNSIEMQRDEDNKRAQSAIIVDICIIITWLIAILAFALDIIILKFIFCSCALALGVVILYVDVIRNEDVLKRWRKTLYHCCEKRYRVRKESSQEENVKLRAKDSFHFQDTLDRKKRAAAILSEGWV